MARIELTDELYQPYREKMQRALQALEEEYASIRAGRPSPKLLERIEVDYYGTMTPLSQMATISKPEARQLYIKPYDKTTTAAIAKQIMNSDLGVNPQDEGDGLRLIFPPLTEDRRKDLVKSTSKLCEETKVSIRNTRREALDVFKNHEKQKEISEDELKIAEDEVQKLTDEFTKKADEIWERKKEDIMQV